MLQELRVPEIVTKPMGLKPLALRGLGKVVVLAGPNGAGKSRCLNLVYSLLQSQEGFEKQMSSERSEAERYRRLAAGSLQMGERAQQLRQAQLFQDQADRRQAIYDAVDPDIRKTFAVKERQVALVRFENETVRPRTDMKEYEADGLASGLDESHSVGLQNSYRAADAYCSRVARALSFAKHPEFSGREDVKASNQRARAFAILLESLLHKPLAADLDHSGRVFPTLAGRPLLMNELSEGERILIAWSIMLHQQVTALRNSVVLLDEPENHLHPDVCLDAVRTLAKTVSEGAGQIWIATHSLPIIAAFELSSTYLVEDSGVAFGGNRTGVLVKRLLGGESNRRALQRILSDVDDLAFHEFAAQCLLRPGVAPHEVGATDKQETLFRRRVADELTQGRHLRVLDYGAGRGRMAAAIAELLRVQPLLASGLDYVAYDTDTSPEDVGKECERNVSALGDLPGVTTKQVRDIRAAQPPSTRPFDIVLLCNVMHEVHPARWQQMFEDVHRCLANDGVALVMEDQQMSVGELPHTDGFLVLDIFQMRTLFNASEQEIYAVANEHADRLSIIELPRQILARHSSLQLRAACTAVAKQALSEASKLREQGELDWRAGRRHAYLAMLALNAQLCGSSLAL